MKKTKIVIAVSAIVMFMVSIPALAQEENGFHVYR